MIVYAKHEETKIWSSVRKNHSQGKVPQYEPLTIMVENNGWYEIKRPDNLSIPPQPNYPNHWVEVENTVPAIPTPPEPPIPPPPPPTGEISDEELASAIVVIIKYLTQ